VIVLAGLACATLQLLLMKASPGTSWKHPLTAAGLADALINIWRSYLPIPWGFPHWHRLHWGTCFVDGLAIRDSIKVGVSLVLGVVSAGVLMRRPAALFLYLVGMVALLSIQFIVNAGALRHKAFLFMLFVAALWIGGDSTQWRLSSSPLQRLGDFFARWQNPFVVGLLVVHLAAGLYVFGADWNYAFSAGQPTAQFLRDSGLSGLWIIGTREAYVAPLSAYLDKPIYYLQSSRFGTYADLSRAMEEPPAPEAVGKALQFAHLTHTNVVLVLAYRTLELEATGVGVASGRINFDGIVLSPSAPRFLSSGTITLMGQIRCFVDERYSIYLIQPD
jgi:hypothetical protein